MSASLFWALCILALLQIPNVISIQYKVGDLDSWGIPPPAKSNLYATWSRTHRFKIGDSLLFLYPPSLDSVVQVTERAYKQCVTSDPITRMDDGNSLFNITAPGDFYFISGEKGHCEKHQKIEIQVASADGKFFPPADSDSPAAAPSAPNVFGPMPMGLGSGSRSGSGGSGSGAARALGRGGVLVAVGSVIGGWILGALL